jgi:hypothetical protein
VLAIDIILTTYLKASADHRPAHFNIEVDGKRGYATSDLIIPHPTKAGLWRVFGRADDQIMLSTGEKVRDISNSSHRPGAYAYYHRNRRTLDLLVCFFNLLCDHRSSGLCIQSPSS